ncbi:NAD-dependent epimerase/dehydratase family protein [Campylobacter sp. MOP7]|uniref:NAD-dependent epimerase/dehydratase family protein n=1 Tax=Campylobacter canis TaxID=3378588 RepID=UPI00387EDDE5
MTILLSGATGFLGSYLLKSFVDDGHKVIALKRSLSNTYRINEYLHKANFYNADRTKLSYIFKKHKIDIVVHAATHYGRHNDSITSVLDTNLMFGLRLLEESIYADIKAFINTDTLLDRNIDSYSLSKSQFVEWMLFLLNKNCKIINIKIEHMYGPFDDENKFVYWLIKQLKKNVEKIDLTSGMQKRDFIYIDDVVRAYQTIINNIDKFSFFEEYELGSGQSIQVKEFISNTVEELGRKHNITTKLNFGAINYRANENMDIKVNIEKLKCLGWNAKVSIREGIKKTIEGEK